MSKASAEGTRRIITGIYDKAKDIVVGTKKAFTTTKPKKQPYMENTRQKQAREDYNKSIAERNREIRARQAVAATAVGVGTVMKFTGGEEETTAAPAPASTERTPISDSGQTATKPSALDWRSRTPSTVDGKSYQPKAVGSSRQAVSAPERKAPKGISYKDVRSGRATAMQESKSRFERAQKAKQSRRIDAEMSKAPTPQAPRSAMDFKPDFQASANYFDSFKKSTAVSSPNPRAEVDTESYQPRPGSRMGIGKYESKQKKPEEVKASMPAPTKKPVRSDYPDTSSYMAAYGAYRRALMAGKL